MSSAFLAEILARPDIRVARRGRAAAILNDDMQTILFADDAGRLLFDAAGGASVPPQLARQLRSAARLVATRGAASVQLRLPSGRSWAASLLRVPSEPDAVILLTADALDAGATPNPDRLLADLGLSPASATLFDRDGVPLGTDTAVASEDALLRRSVRTLVEDDGSATELGLPQGLVRLLRIDEEHVLALRHAMPVRPEEQAPKIAALVERWQGTRVPHGETTDPRPEIPQSVPDPMHAKEEPAASQPVEVPLDDEPATPSDHPVVDAPETRQPIDIPSVVTLPDRPANKVADSAQSAFSPRFDASPIRFVWQIDADGRFRSISSEFVAAVGPKAASVTGRLFSDVAADYGFDRDNAINRLLERRDTWSGRTVLWPVEGTGRRVPIDLAALPIYTRERTFEGFRGFGIVRVSEHEADPEARGLALASRPDDVEQAAAVDETVPVGEEPRAETPPSLKPMFRTFEAELPGVSFGRRSLTPQSPEAGEGAGDRTARNDGERRRAGEAAVLSEAEEAAFREIGAKLGQERLEAETPGALRFETQTPATDEPDDTGVTVDTGRNAEQEGEDSDGTSDAGTDVAIGRSFADSPLPVLVQGGGHLVFANRALLDLTGHADLEALKSAGGLGILFAEDDAGEAEPGRMRVLCVDGRTVEARVHMQRVPFEGRSFLMMSFEPAPAEPEPTIVRAVAEPDANAELRRKLEELQAVLDIATDGVVLVDSDGMIRAANGSAEALFGANEAELRGCPLSGLFAHESQRAVRDYLDTLKDRGLAGVMNDGREVIGRVAQGGFVPLFITVGHVPDERGWCVVIRDMSHWKRIEEELLNAKRAAEAASLHKSRFLANVSHELRTPLNAIIGFADVMASECFGPIGNERYIEYLGDIKRSGHHVLDLVNDLLDISKIEAGKMELTFESVSLNEVLSEVVATMQPQANRERVIVRSNLPASVPSVVADRRTIRQIALNLLSNSVRFTPAGGQIIASTTYTAGGDVLLRVRDSGVGMTAREIEVAMKPFQQVHRSGEARGQGTGLGLPLTKAMAEANRATFAIRSTPGEGTLVEIAFPAQRVLAD